MAMAPMLPVCTYSRVLKGNSHVQLRFYFQRFNQHQVQVGIAGHLLNDVQSGAGDTPGFLLVKHGKTK
jgi:hypothetical protein